MSDISRKSLSDHEKWKILADYDANQAASVMGETDREKAAQIAESLGVSYMVEVVSHLDSDAAADLLRSLPEDFRTQIIRELNPTKAQPLNEILSYQPGTAGSIMSKEFLSIDKERTVQQTTHYLQNLPQDKKGKVSYIYVVDSERRLAGVIQIRDLIFHTPATPIKDILRSPVVQVETAMTQMDVAKLLQRHRYLGLPVVDDKQRLVGVISADNALQVIQDEATDDIAKIVGTGAEEMRTRSILTIMRLRLPWLSVNLASGLLCAFISGIFETGIPSVTLLFLFIPVMLGLSESTGVQGATIIVRNITLGHVNFKDLGALFVREIFVGILIGIVCGTVVGFVGTFWKASPVLGLALGLSLVVSIIISGMIGLTLPLIFRKFKIDPAIASGPLVLAICDLQTLLVYFNLSHWILTR